MNKKNRFFARRHNLLGLGIVFIYILVAAVAPYLVKVDTSGKQGAFRIAPDVKGNLPQAPSREYPFGTLPTGTLRQQYDIYYTVIWGTRSALQFGLIVACSTAIFGVVLGAASAYFGGTVNSLTMRVTDAFLTFPIIAGVVIFQQFLNMVAPSSGNALPASASPISAFSTLQSFVADLDPIMLAFILFSWMPYARIMNAVVLSTKDSDYIQAARSLGAGHLRIIFRHLIPNTISPAIVLIARDIGGMVLLEATMTFIGFGTGSEWGALLAVGRRWVIGPGGNPLVFWWVFIPATLALVLFGFGFNLLGDGLNDWLNPRQNSMLQI